MPVAFASIYHMADREPSERSTIVMNRRTFAAITLLVALAAVALRAVAVSEIDDSSLKKFNASVIDAMKSNDDVYLYFYSKDYPESKKAESRIRALAGKESAGFVSADVESHGGKGAAMLYEIAFVPSVIHIHKGLGIVEVAAGPSNVKKFTADRKPFRQTAVTKRISGNSRRGAVTILEFYADWCNPCLEQMPVLESVQKQSSGLIDVYRLNVDKEMETMRIYNISNPPTNVVIDRNGIPRARLRSVSTPESLTDFLKKSNIID